MYFLFSLAHVWKIEVHQKLKDRVNSSNTDTRSLLSWAADVFADTAPVVVSVLDGYNVCIFAYGQTGTGKTFTMEGYQGNRGVNYRTLEELFNVASQRRGQVKYEISVSVMEVYNEQIRDLLAPPAPQDQAPKK
jgi:kinesin family protein C2/C3